MGNELNTEEFERIQSMQAFERRLWAQGLHYVAGMDESGRGPLAGPVVAAAVIFAEGTYIPMINDSKKLSAEIREFLFDIIIHETLGYGLGLAEVEEIDRINIYQASFLAMQRALKQLRLKPDHLLVDGRAYPHDSVPFTTVVKGDRECFSIAAASILAKVTRDRIMRQYDEQYPQYGFARHKGYPTRAHLDAIEKYGFSSIHRKSFHPKRLFANSISPNKNAKTRQ
ncbi:MAG: ribonuclease HII [bacterium]